MPGFSMPGFSMAGDDVKNDMVKVGSVVTIMGLTDLAGPASLTTLINYIRPISGLGLADAKNVINNAKVGVYSTITIISEGVTITINDTIVDGLAGFGLLFVYKIEGVIPPKEDAEESPIVRVGDTITLTGVTELGKSNSTAGIKIYRAVFGLELAPANNEFKNLRDIIGATYTHEIVAEYETSGYKFPDDLPLYFIYTKN